MPAALWRNGMIFQNFMHDFKRAPANLHGEKVIWPEPGTPGDTNDMGITQVTVAVSNPANREKRWEALFLVDTVAVDSMVPRSALVGLGIEPEAKRSYELADGSEIKMDIAIARLEFMGEVVGATVLFGPDDAEPILGVTALESVGIEVDPQSQRLKRLPATRLKKIIPLPPGV